MSTSLYIIFGLTVLGIFSEAAPVSAQALTSFGEYTYSGSRLTGPQSEVFPQNNLTFWNPYECEPKGGSGSGSGVRSDSCFKINSSVGAQDFWYAEGCINNGTCTSGIYFEGSEEMLTLVINNKSVLWDSNKTRFRDDVIKTDDDFGGLQYINAENYDFEYSASETKLTPNGGSSTRKYYWIALPDEAYTKGFGDTYVATFENLSEPVYFITFDAHACGDQSEGYCDKALADPNGVEVGGEFLGALSKNGGSPTEAANKAGKLTSFCRINGTGEVLTASNGSASSITATSGEAASTPSSESSTPSSTPSTSDTSGVANTTAGKTVAEKIWNWFVNANIPGLSDNPAAIAGIIGAFATEAGGNTIEGLTPFSWSSWGGTLLGCIPQYCGDIKSRVTSAVGHDYFAYQTGVDGIPEDAVDKAIDLELKFMMNNYNSGINWRTFIENLDAVSNKTPESYAELFEVIVQNAADASGDAVQDEGIINWVASHPGYSTVQQVLGKKRALAREAYEKLADGDCSSPEGNYPQYFQAGQSWSSVSYDGGNIGDSGCGPSSMAMIASAVTGQEIYPNDVVSVTSPGCYVYTSGSGMTDLDKKVGERYGFEVINVDYSSTEDAIAKMKQYLNDGYMLHFSGAGSAPFTSGGHYVGAFGIDGDTVHVADSNLGNADYNVGDLVRAGLHGGAFSASKSSGARSCGTAASGDNICSDGPSSSGSGGSGAMVEGGLSEAQAQKIADYYNSGAVSSSGLPMGTKENCVSFSAWFVSYLTDVTNATNPTRGDGLDVAGNLASDFGLQTSQTPQVYSVFSNPSGTPVNGSSNHTGVIVGIEGDQVITIEAAYGGWAGQSDGLARVWKYTMPSSGMLYAQLNGHIDTSRLSSIVGS